MTRQNTNKIQTLVDGIETELEIIKPKPASQSKTIKTNSLGMIIGWIAMALPYLVDLENILNGAMGMELTPDSIWLVGIVLQVVTTINIVLRFVTELPIKPLFGGLGTD
jgi:hypothetical protein